MRLFNIFRRRKKKPTTQEQVRQVFNTLAQLEQSRLLLYDRKSKRLYIEHPLAAMMAKDETSWLHFMQNCWLWINCRMAEDAWQNYILSEEQKAVHRARKRFPKMTANDIDRVKRARRKEIGMGELTPPQTDGFEFFIIRETTEPKADGGMAVPGGEVYAVGTYNADDDNWQSAPWKDVKRLLEKQK